MRLLPVIAASLCVTVSSPGADATRRLHEPGPSPYPSQAADWPGEGVVRVFEWMRPHRERFWQERQQSQGAWVLAGDSQLENWRAWREDLAPRRVANRAIGGDVSRGLLFRFQEDILDLNPSGIVLLIGGNDLSARQSTDQTARNIERMLNAITALDPSLPIILCTLPPRASTSAPIRPSELTKLNNGIKQLAETRNNVALLDLFPLFATSDGRPEPALFTEDLLHISKAGYKVLGRAMKMQLDTASRQTQ